MRVCVCVFLCVCLCVCVMSLYTEQLFARFSCFFYLSEVVYFKRYCFVLTIGVQVSHLVFCSTRHVHGCITGGGVPYLLDKAASSIWSTLDAAWLCGTMKDQLAWHFPAEGDT